MRWPLLLVVLFVGCTSSNDSAATGSNAVSDVTTSDTSVEAAPSDDAEIETGPGDLYLTNPEVGLELLSGYTATLTVTFTGTQDGQPREWANVYTLRFAAAPRESQLTIKSSGDGGDDLSPLGDDVVLLAEMPGSAFVVSGNGSCEVIATDTEGTLLGPYVPAARLAAVLGAEVAGQDTIAGAVAGHYTFDERAVLATADTQGEVWVAVDGGHVVKMLVTTTGDSDYFGEGMAGTIVEEYVLSDINQPTLTDLPASCIDGWVDVPLLDAAKVQRSRGSLRYETTASVGDAVAFYRQQLAAAGWTTLGEPDSGNPAAVTLHFGQGEWTLFMVVDHVDGVTVVDIVQLGPAG